MPHTLRIATASDEPFLRAMLWMAANWRDESADVPLAPEVLPYVEGFGRDGDAGLVAVVDDQPVGAAWARRFSVEDRTYGFVGEDVPEISIGVRPSCRGLGIGTTLLDALKRRLAAAGCETASLSVEPDNPARRIYERAGFVRVSGRDGAWTMVVSLLGSRRAEA